MGDAAELDIHYQSRRIAAGIRGAGKGGIRCGFIGHGSTMSDAFALCQKDILTLLKTPWITVGFALKRPKVSGYGEMADAPDLGSGGVTRGGSSPSTRTNRPKNKIKQRH